MINNQPSVSIVVPMYNAGAYLNDSIPSILTQTFADFELIVVDDGSTDNSVDIIKSYKDSRIVLLKNDHDFIRSLNCGMTAARGTYIARMDADDIMLPDRLKIQYEYMESHPEVDVCGGWMERLGNGEGVMQQPLSHNDILSTMLIHSPLYHPTVMMKREVVDNIPIENDLRQCYRADYIYVEDYKLWVDLAVRDHKFANIPEIIVKYRMSEGQNTNRFATHMYNSSQRTRAEYLEYVSEKLVENDESLFEIINGAIDLTNRNILSFDTLTRIIRDIYAHNLGESRMTGKQHVLFCTHSLGSGGAEKVLIDILKRLDYGKYCVDLLLLEHSGVRLPDVPAEVRLISSNENGYLDKVQYDTEIAFLEGAPVRYISNRKSNARKIAWIHTDLHSLHWTKIYYIDDAEEAVEYARMDEIVFVSKDAHRQFEILFPDVETPKTVIYNLTDADDIRSRSNAFVVEKTKLTLCCVGRLSEQKAYPRLISVIDRLAHDDGLDFEVWILGDGHLRQEMEMLIKQRGLDNVVSLKGFQKNPYPYMKAADMFVLASLAEGLPLVVSEALCLGKPILATDCAGLKELLDNGTFGMLVENNEEAIYQGLKRMITDEALRADYSRKARSRSEMFDPDETMKQIHTHISP